MTQRLLPLAFAATLGFGSFIVLNSTSSAQDDARGGTKAPAAQDAEEGHEHGELHENMEKLNAKMKAMRKLLKPDMKEKGVEACTDMETLIVESLAHAPEPLKKLEGIELMAYENDFKKRMLAVYGTVLDLKLAIASGDADGAKLHYRALGAQKKEGHNVFIDGQEGK